MMTPEEPTAPPDNAAVGLSHYLPGHPCEPDTHHQTLLEQVAAQARQIDELQQQQESARLFMAAIDQSSESIFFTDAKGTILYVNRCFEETSGYRRDELIGQNPRLLKSGLHPHSFYQHMWRTLLSGQVFRGQLVNKRKDGSLYQAEAHIAPVRNPLGKITRFVSVKTDIAKFVEAQRKLESINQDLARSNAELEQFAYVASHDLQEPLRSVSSCLQLLKMRYAGQLDDRADEFIAHAVAANQRMRELIDALLALSRINADAALVPTNSAAVFSMVRENLAQSIEESGAQLTWEELPVVSAIPQMLGQLLQNLVGNAIKFRGDGPPVVRVGVQREGPEWVFSVSDQGIGIEPQHFERIFLLFQRLHTREEYTGTGLGLAICQKIVERHGGRIWLESQPGHGSTFFFTLRASH